MKRSTTSFLHRSLLTIAVSGLLVLGAAGTPPAAAQVGTTQPAPTAAADSGPVRLRQNDLQDARQTTSPARTLPFAESAAPPPYKAGEFEIYVQSIGGLEIRRFGAELLAGPTASLAASDFSPVVPPDYVVQPGDELLLTIWGAVDADLRLQVDRSGRVTIPRVGPVMVAGVRHADLPDVVSRRVAQVFKNFQLSVSLGQLRGLRVYVTGFVQRPGVQVVSALSTLAQAVMRAGGPSASGSFRSVQLRRGRELVGTFDLYDLLLKGDRSGDRLVQADDVIHVTPVGPQVAVIGSVNRPAVFELKTGETVDDVLRMAGGFAAVADTTRLAIERLDERSSVRVTQINLPGTGSTALRTGDVLRAFNAMGVAQPVQRQNKRVRIEGEVLAPGEYVLPAESTLNDALRKAGGFTPSAFVFGAEFTRESVRLTNQVNYERALRDLETDLARASGTQRVSTADDLASQNASYQASSRLIERLRAARPTGRLVLQLPPEGGQLPELSLEDGDRLYVPPRPTSVGVFGSVFNPGNYLFTAGRQVNDYLRLAGGATRGADSGSAFVVRANGAVAGGLERTGWFGRSGGVEEVMALPGDTLFVPEEMNKTTFVQSAKDWTQILYQLGIGIAGIKSAVK